MAEQKEEYKKIIEAALFVSAKALSTEELAQVLGIGSVGSVNNIMNELMNDYEKRDSSLGIFKIGDKYIMSVKEPFANKVGTLAGSPDLTRGALRILAYISKNEPVIQSSVVKSFGSATYEYLKELNEKEFITAKKTGRTKKLETTDKFKEYFNF